MVAKLPVTNNSKEADLRGIVFWAAGLAGLFLTYGAAGLVKFALRSLVEVAVVCVVFMNAVVAAFASSSSAYFVELVSGWKFASSENVLLLAFAVVLGSIFAVDVLVMLVLYPIAKVAGSNMLD